MTTPEPEPLLSLRAAVVFTLAGLSALAAGALMFWKERSVPGAMMSGGGAFVGAVALFNYLIKK